MGVAMNAGVNVVERLDETVAALRARANLVPAVGVVLGSGLGAFGESIRDVVRIPYADVPNIPPPRVVGHAGNFLFGHVTGHVTGGASSVPVVCMQGRIHGYEGHPTWQVVHGVRAMARLGAKAILLTNAAGGLEPSWSAGDLMIVADHLNLMHTSPLIGPNEEALGTRFPDMTNAYDADLRKKLAAVGAAEKIALRADRRSEGGVLDVAAGEDAAALRRDRGADAVTRVRRVGALANLGRGAGELVEERVGLAPLRGRRGRHRFLGGGTALGLGRFHAQLRIQPRRRRSRSPRRALAVASTSA